MAVQLYIIVSRTGGSGKPKLAKKKRKMAMSYVESALEWTQHESWRFQKASISKTRAKKQQQFLIRLLNFLLRAEWTIVRPRMASFSPPNRICIGCGKSIYTLKAISRRNVLLLPNAVFSFTSCRAIKDPQENTSGSNCHTTYTLYH